MKMMLESAFERWAAGERSPALYVFAAAAAPASLLYRLGLVAKPHLGRRFPALKNSRLVVVSSPVVGGVGKTPLTALLANSLKADGKRVGIVTMGYGRSSTGPSTLDAIVPGQAAQGVGDEAAELFLTTGCPAHVGDEPAHVISGLDDQDCFDTILFDDGVSRVWDNEQRVVVIADSDLDFPVRYLPFGRWRTTPEFIRAATYVAVTNSSGEPISASQVKRLSEWGYNGPVGAFTYRTDGLVPFPSPTDKATPDGRPFVFCGISRPKRFRESVRSLGFEDSTFVALPDHHQHTRETLVGLDRLREQRGCGWFLTTLKDVVKIDPAWIGSTPLYFLRIALHQTAGPDILTALTKDG
jgi:tetraacyldisaccharide 4'-kinase